MSVKFSNNGKTTLSAGISASDTSIPVTDASVLPVITGSEYFYVSLEDTSGNVEIIKVTGVSSNTLTATRAQESTTARAFVSGDKAENRLTAGGLTDVATSGGTITGDLALGDNVKAKFGASDDLQIYHNGNNSFIEDKGTGNLYVRAANNIFFQGTDENEALATFQQNGFVKLYNNNSLKLSTTSTGIDVTGGMTSSGRIKTTDGLFQADAVNQRFRQYSVGSGSGNATFLLGKIRTNGSSNGGVTGVVKAAYDPGDTLTNVNIHFAFAQRNGNHKGHWWYEHTDDDAANDVVSVKLIDDGSNNYYVWLYVGDFVQCFVETAWRQVNSGQITDSGTLTASTITSGTTLFDTANNPTSEHHIGKLYAHNDIDVTGDVSLGDNGKLLLGASDDLEIYHDGSHSYISDSGTGRINVKTNVFRIYNAAGDEISANFVQDGAVTLYYNNSAKLATTSTGIDVTGTVSASGGNSTNWNTAYGWGNHASAGYLTSHQDISGKLDSSAYTAADVLTKIKTVDGSGSGLDADTLDGYNTSTSATANTVVVREGSGHIYGNYILGSYFNASYGNSENPTIGQIWTQNTSDNYLRKSTPAHLISQLGLFTTSNDGSGSGLDADTLDGVQGSSYLRSDTGDTFVGHLKVTGAGSYASGTDSVSNGSLVLTQGKYIYSEHNNQYLRNIIGHTTGGKIQIGQSGTSLINGIDLYTGTSGNNTLTLNGNKIWNAGNDGSGSGLDADTVDGQHASAFATTSSNVTGLSITGIGNNNLTYDQTSATRNGYTGWAGHLISNHGDGSNYYMQDIILPFWSSPKLSRRQGSSTIVGPYDIWTSENDGSGSGLDADTCDGQHLGTSANVQFGSVLSTGNVTAYSDRRIKEDITRIPDALSKVQSLTGNTYTRNDQEDTVTRYAGLIAQEVEQVLPEAVKEADDGIKALDYNATIALLVESIKELKSEVDDLKIQLEKK